MGASPAQNIPEEITGGEFSVAEVTRAARLSRSRRRQFAPLRRPLTAQRTPRPQVFGDAIIKKLNSDKWSEREEAL